MNAIFNFMVLQHNFDTGVHYTRVVDDEEEGATEAPAPGNQQTSSITQPGPGATGP